MTNWKVKIYEATPVSEERLTKVAAKHLDSFGVVAKDVDKALEAAKTWLRDHGYTVRSVNILSSAANELVAYVKPKEE